MSLDRPQARIPIAYVTIDNKRYECEISRHWLQFQLGVFSSLGGTASATTPDLDSALQFDVREADWAELAKRVIDLERDQWAQASPADVAQLGTRLDNIAGDEPVHLMAHIAELSKRVVDLETELSATVSLHAQVAQLAAQIQDLQNDKAFA